MVHKMVTVFNPEKCKVMHIGHQLPTRYYMTDGSNRVEMQSVTEEKDLGVTFTNDLKSRTQCFLAAAKARRIIGAVRRNFRRLDCQDLLLIYKTYIRPHIEYCIQSWSPHLRKDIQCLENVQKAATRLVPELRKLTYDQRLQKLGLLKPEEEEET